LKKNIRRPRRRHKGGNAFFLSQKCLRSLFLVNRVKCETSSFQSIFYFFWEKQQLYFRFLFELLLWPKEFSAKNNQNIIQAFNLGNRISVWPMYVCLRNLILQRFT
jgi:hypothetical protein